MRDHWRRLSLRDMSRFVGVVAIVAVVGVMIGREAGIGRQTGASVAPAPADESPPLPQQQSEETTALTLTLSAADICETERGRGYAGQEFVYDDDGKAIGTRDISTGWDGVAEIPVRWEVSGGTAPYTLVIDNETRDGDGPYKEASGTASVSCAVTSAEVFYTSYNERRFRGDPEIDSGPKTIRATVTDANGATGEASVSIYVILVIGGGVYERGGEDVAHRLLPGRTYRYDGHLFTIPESITLVASHAWDADGGGSAQVLLIEGTKSRLAINIHGEEVQRVIRMPADSAFGSSTEASSTIDDALDEFFASRGKAPSVGRNE